MKITSFETTSPLTPVMLFSDDKPLCVLVGPSVFLQMMRCLLDGEDDGTPVDADKARVFVSRVSFVLDGVARTLCGVLCEDGSFFVALEEGDGFASKAQTAAFLRRLRVGASDARSCFSIHQAPLSEDALLSEGALRLAQMERFLALLRKETEGGDRRPIYVFGWLERVDEAVDVTPYLDALASLGRQVFLAVDAAVPEERLAHPRAQVVRLGVTE